MAIDIASQTEVFLMACLLGALLAAFYDIFRIMRLAFTTPNWVIFIEDIMFCIIVTVASFWYLMSQNMGQIRGFVIVGEVLGGIIYYFTLGTIVINFAQIIIEFCKKVIAAINRYIIMPLWKILRLILMVLWFPIAIILKIIRKITRRIKFRLKRRYIMMYNLSNNNLSKQSGKGSAGNNEKG